MREIIASQFRYFAWGQLALYCILSKHTGVLPSSTRLQSHSGMHHPHTLLSHHKVAQALLLLCRKLKNDLAAAQKDADHHRLLAHTVSKSYALAITENERLKEANRLAKQQAQQQSRQHKLEAHSMQNKLNAAMQQISGDQAAKQPLFENVTELAAAEHRPCGTNHQTAEACQQDNICKLHTNAASQTELITSLATAEQDPIDLTHAEQHQQDRQHAEQLQERISFLERERTCLISQLPQSRQQMQTLWQDKPDHRMESVFAQKQYQQAMKLLESAGQLYERVKPAVYTLNQPFVSHAPLVSQGGQSTPDVSLNAHLTSELEHKVEPKVGPKVEPKVEGGSENDQGNASDDRHQQGGYTVNCRKRCRHQRDAV